MRHLLAIIVNDLCFEVTNGPAERARPDMTRLPVVPGALSFTTMMLVSKATVFHHFASVDEILLAACDWRQSLELEGHQPTSARAYLDGLGQQLVRAAQSDPVLLKAQAVFVTRAIFDREMNARLSEGVADMHRLVVEALRTRLPSNVSDAEIESIARLAEMALDGLMINLVTHTDERAQFQQAWTLMVDLLLAGAKSG